MSDDTYDDDVEDDVDYNRADDADGEAAEVEYNDAEEPAPIATAVLEFLATQLVDDPDAVDIEARENRGSVELNVRVGDGDMGRVIGRRGRIAQSIRQVVGAAATHDDVRVSVEFVD